MKVCLEPGCGAIQRESRCTEHRRQREQARGTRQERGYDAEHRRLRADWQRRMDAGLVVRCWRCDGLIDPQAWALGHCDVDRSRYHGPECPPCDYATSGRVGCPHSSHQRRTQVTVVCGPPCSGKTTWVRERAKPADLIVDYDDIAQRLGSPHTHGHHPRYHKRVEVVIARAIEGVRQGRHERAWIIRSGVERGRALADSLGGELVVLDEPDDVLHQRAQQRRDPAATVRAIREWRQMHPRISPDA